MTKAKTDQLPLLERAAEAIRRQPGWFETMQNETRLALGAFHQRLENHGIDPLSEREEALFANFAFLLIERSEVHVQLRDVQEACGGEVDEAFVRILEETVEERRREAAASPPPSEEEPEA